MRYLLVEDEPLFRERLARALTEGGSAVTAVGSRAEALEAAREGKFDRAILDLRLSPSETGLEVLSELLKVQPELPAVVLTGYGSIATTQEAMRAGAVAYLTKPCGVDRIIAAFETDLSGTPYRSRLTTPSLAQVEWDHIHRVLLDCGGNITRAAQVLGLDRRSLQRKLNKTPPLA